MRMSDADIMVAVDQMVRKDKELLDMCICVFEGNKIDRAKLFEFIEDRSDEMASILAGMGEI